MLLHAISIAIAIAILPGQAFGQRMRSLIPNEQGRVQVRDSGDYCPAPLPRNLEPPTVSTDDGLPELKLSLDDAIRIALENTDVVRVLSGAGAASTGQTIYSPGIANAGIDQARAIFDPNLSIRNNFLRSESPSPEFDPADPTRTIINGTRSDNYDLNFDLTKRFLNGADGGLQVGSRRSRSQPGLFPQALNPFSNSDVTFSLTQPLLRGRGVDVNSVPVVLAFLDTESSYFRLKNSLQNMVAGVIQGYWDLVQARTERWVAEQQINQIEFLYEADKRRKEVGLFNQAQFAQTSAQLANFKANLIAAEANILDRVASLKGILGLPPGSDFTIVPTAVPVQERLEFDWEALVALAEERRPDLVELKIVLEADQQRILQARNRARPQLDAVALYRWNGLEGRMPIGDRIESRAGQHTDWALGINFSVPLTLRSDRASLRQNELLLANDRLNLQQGLLQASHGIARVLRTIEQLYQQYEAFGLAREAAEASLDQIWNARDAGRVTFLEVLLAINTWASSKNSEARAITQLNAALATLEAETGTILETHGVRLFEERYCSLGPLGRRGSGRQFPARIRPSSNAERYASGDEPSENAFNLEVPSIAGSSASEQDYEGADPLRRLPPVPNEDF